MKRRFRQLSETQLKQIIVESVKKALKESEYDGEKFVNWDEVKPYWNYGFDFVDKNWERSNRLGIPDDCRCELCQKALKDGYKTLYFRIPSEEEYNDGGSSSRYYLNPVPGSKPIKIGKTCYKSFVKAFKNKYGN